MASCNSGKISRNISSASLNATHPNLDGSRAHLNSISLASESAAWRHAANSPPFTGLPIAPPLCPPALQAAAAGLVPHLRNEMRFGFSLCTHCLELGALRQGFERTGMALLAPRTPVDWMALGARLLNHSGIMKYSRICHALQGHDQSCMAHAAVFPAQSQQSATSCFRCKAWRQLFTAATERPQCAARSTKAFNGDLQEMN